MTKFNKEVMWSSKTEEWETPQDVFDYKTQTSDMIDARLNVISLHNTKCNGILTVVVSNDGLYDRFVRSLQ